MRRAQPGKLLEGLHHHDAFERNAVHLELSHHLRQFLGRAQDLLKAQQASTQLTLLRKDADDIDSLRCIFGDRLSETAPSGD